ncbi:sigma-54-dependent Fis family transcriptional regulator [Calditerricola satsumensis]|uniref:sigma-54-dependent Fis family transcriptional regulator n=2 Tax=Calditerricola satsumensis TaxID=373054 RepID=UPI001664785A|nr:sigma-54-dependent Fis family transcriptional regulator [Calditerricola satsumensis]
MHNLQASWQRSRRFGVHPERVEPVLLSEAELRRRRDAQREFLREAEGWLHQLYGWVKQWGAMVLAADANGVILDGKGDPVFTKDASRVHLASGSDWSEPVKGTNAIGTALAEKRAVAVVGDEHYCKENWFLCCAASPVFAPDGSLAGVLDVSGYAGAYHPSVLTLVDLTAQAVEEALVRRRANRHLLLRLASDAPAWQAVVAVDPDGRIAWGTRGAYAGPLGRVAGRLWETVFAVPLDDVVRGSRHARVVVNGGDARDVWCEVLDDRRPRAVGISHPASLPATPESGRAEGERDAPPKDGGLAGASAPSSPPRRTGASGAARRVAWAARYTFDDLIGSDPAFLKALAVARKAARTDEPVLLLGETGTGKEMLAHAIHRASPRADGPFVPVNCGAIPDNLRESEWFGYEKGAFTGANPQGQPGKFELASGGTLFLDEIGDMPLEAQGVLLRVLQERQVVRLGGRAPIAVDVRIIAATHRDLWAEVKAGRFRADLFYRLQGVVITLPPLRQRSDRVELAERLLAGIAAERGLSSLSLTDAARSLIVAHPWPGNVRQLYAALRQAAWEAEQGWVDAGHFPEWVWRELASEGSVEAAAAAEGEGKGPQAGSFSAPLASVVQPALPLATLERDALLRALQAAGGNKRKAAELLGISRSTLYRKLRAFGFSI